MADDDLQVGVTPIGQQDQPPPEPAYGPAPRAQLVGSQKQEVSPGEGVSTGDQVQKTDKFLSDLNEHVYQLAKRSEADAERYRAEHQDMEAEVKRLYQEETVGANAPRPTLQPYPDQPDLSRRPAPVVLAHAFMAIPQMLFGGFTKYLPGGAGHALADVNNAKKNGASQGTIAERIALYREQVNIVHDQNEEILKQYESVANDRRADTKTKLEAISTLASLYKDDGTRNAAELGDWDKFTEYLSKARKLQEDTVTKVYGTLDELDKAFGNDPNHRYWLSDGAEKYPELFNGLYSTDPRAKGAAVKALEKKMPFWKWFKENRDWLYSTESAGEGKEELGKAKEPPDKPDDKTKEAIRKLHPNLFGLPAPSASPPAKKEDRRSAREKFAYDPRHPFEKPKATDSEE